MPDVSIVNTTVTPAPTDYTVPGTQELLVKAVRASIDGSGAASSYLPALQLLNPAGQVMWTAVNPSDVVAAGASVDASWFPGVMGAGSPVVSCYARKFGSFSLTAGSHVVTWVSSNLHTNSPATFSINSGLGRIAVAHGGLFMTTVFIEFATTAGVPFTGLFEVTTTTLDATNASVESLTTPEINYAELYATNGADTFFLNGFGLVNANDSTYTPPYNIAYNVSTDTAITAFAISYGVTILNPSGLA